VRERQDLLAEWQSNDKRLLAGKSELPSKRNVEAEKILADRLAAIDARVSEIDRRLAIDFPNFAALRSPAPISVSDVQAQLGRNEALVLVLDTSARKTLPPETFIWVVTKSDLRWVRSELGTEALIAEVMALRCGLDRTAWYGTGFEKCAKALGLQLAKAPRPEQPLPFDVARANRLYSALFAEVQDMILGKHLILVPSGPLTQLPLQVLVTKPSTASDYRAAAWLAREHAISVLPAVSSLKALRRVAKPSAAKRPMIGFGNPLLDGPDERYQKRRQLTRERQRCRDGQRLQLAAAIELRDGASKIETRGGLANIAHIKAQVPLPETADELCAVGREVKARPSDIHLGTSATEREIKRLSSSGELASYRLVHFATHGALAGQLDGSHEPGLILTPPDNASEEDDGYLSASEIAALKLDADWVILSACNTAAGQATSAEALSGLARAFIYAQARALLVSHWEVYSAATVKLITAAVRALTSNPKLGRAEAIRSAMLALIDKGKPEEAHPAYWAPFVVIGEGAR
jgi:CHAT domain-containing protein